ncbi:MAG: GNAT family N-acetyltransferase [Oscillospiraceae bacterium]|jgi:predicted acetyltransferase|nr:GNAT family N-acetyltransferase [Oscillospiraceae bacterium]
MPVRFLTPEDRMAYERIQSIAFVNSMDEKERKARIDKDPGWPVKCIGHFAEDGTLTACMALPEYAVYFDGRPVKMVGVGGVASLPEHRHGGAVRALFQAALRDMVADGAVFSALYPFSHAFYRQFGYELSALAMQYELPTEALKPFRCEAQARMLTAGDSADAVKAVYAAYSPRHNLATQRTDAHWTSALPADPLKERVYPYLLSDESGPSAYLVIAAEGAFPDTICARVRELAFARPKGLRDALGFLYRLAAQYEKMRIALPSDVPLPALLAANYDIEPMVRERPMARVINAAEALALARYEEETAFTLRVHDDGVPENDAAFSVIRQNGRTTVERLPQGCPADCEMDVRTLAPLLLGFLSFEEACYKPDLIVRANAESLHRAFGKKSVYLTEYF